MPSEQSQGSQYLNPKQDPAWADRWHGPELKKYKDSVYDKISELLLAQWSRIEPYVDGDGLKALQKTYKDGKLTTGRDDDGLLVVYESDVDANADDEKIEGALLAWLEFINVSQLSLDIVTTSELSEEGNPLPPNLILKAPDKTDFNINEIIGTFELKDINLKDNVSQFMNLDKSITNVNRNKLSEHMDLDFSELSPITFTQFLDQYKKLKESIPLRYRSDDFFQEYSDSTLPIEYRIEKLFEEFERIRNNIPRGGLTSYDEIEPTLEDSLTDEQLFGWQTLTYLSSTSQLMMGTNDPLYSAEDAKSWLDRINTLYGHSSSLVTDNNIKQQIIDDLEAKLAALGEGLIDIPQVDPVSGCTDSTALNYNPAATIDDGTCEYDFVDDYVTDEGAIMGCTDPEAINYDCVKGNMPPAGESSCGDGVTTDDFTCIYSEAGCMDPSAINYDIVRNPQFDYCKSPDGFVSRTECIWPNGTECSVHGTGWTCNGSCYYADDTEVVLGCTVPEAWNYNPLATEDDGTCGCFGTEKYRDVPPPYDVACEPGPEHPGTQNMNSCTCDYPNISLSWSRHSSDCYDYSTFGASAKCKCTCKSNKPSIAGNQSWNDLGDCSVAFEDDETNCKTKCDNKCATLGTSISGKPDCPSGTTWNGSFCGQSGETGGILKTGGPVPSIDNPGPTREVNPEIVIPTRTVDFSSIRPLQKPSKQFAYGGKLGSRRTQPQLTKRNVGISFEAARTEVDGTGNITKFIKPYSVNTIINKTKQEFQQKTGRTMSQKHLTELTNIITVAQGMIGAHYHTLGEWAQDNVNIVASALGLPIGGNILPQIACGGDCSQTAIGSCESVCVGVLCETMPGITDTSLPPGQQTTVPKSKSYGINIRFKLDW